MPIQYRISLLDMEGFNITESGGTLTGIWDKVQPFVGKQGSYLSNFKVNGGMCSPYPCIITRPLANRVILRVYPAFTLLVSTDDSISVTFDE